MKEQLKFMVNLKIFSHHNSVTVAVALTKVNLSDLVSTDQKSQGTNFGANWRFKNVICHFLCFFAGILQVRPIRWVRITSWRAPILAAWGKG